MFSLAEKYGIIAVAEAMGLAHLGHRIMSREGFRTMVTSLARCAHILSRAQTLVVLEMAGWLKSKNPKVKQVVTSVVRGTASPKELMRYAAMVSSTVP